VSATIVRRYDFDVLDRAAAVAILVLDPRIRQLDVSLLVWQLVLLGPSDDCLLAALRRFSALTTSPVLGLQESLILALQLLFEDHTTDAITPLSEMVGSLHVRVVDPGVVGQLTGF
jgi:hypothetical protein